MKAIVKWTLCAVLSLGSLPAHAIAYTIDNLGVGYAGGASAWDINDAGQVAGSVMTAPGFSEAALWSGGGWQLLSPGMEGRAHGVNEHGHVVGAIVVAGASVATLWRDGAAQSLPGFADEHSVAQSINNAGQIVGTSTDSGFGRSRPVLWDDGGAHILPRVGGWQGVPAKINERGQIAGYSIDGGRRIIATLWDGGNAIALAEPFAPSYAFGINNHGTVVGTIGSAVNGGAAIWRTDGAYYFDDSDSTLNDINDAGVAVGQAGYDESGLGHAMLFLEGTAYDLNSLIVGDRNGAGTLRTALGINNRGQILVLGARSGDVGADHAFLLTPVPEPAHWTMFLVGLGLVACAARRKA